MKGSACVRQPVFTPPPLLADASAKLACWRKDERGSAALSETRPYCTVRDPLWTVGKSARSAGSRSPARELELSCWNSVQASSTHQALGRKTEGRAICHAARAGPERRRLGRRPLGDDATRGRDRSRRCAWSPWEISGRNDGDQFACSEFLLSFWWVGRRDKLN